PACRMTRPWTIAFGARGATTVGRRLQVLCRPLIDAVEGLVQVLEGIGDAEAQEAFSEVTERGTGKTRDACLFEDRIGELFRRPAGLRDVRESVEGALRHAARESFYLIQTRDEDIAATLELVAHVIDGGLVSAESFDARDLRKARGAGVRIR